MPEIAFPSDPPASLGILNLTETLLPIPEATSDCAPGASAAQLVEWDGVPPLSYLLIADRLAELYETVFPEHPLYLAEVVAWRTEEDVAEAVERFLGRVSELFPIHEEIWDLDLETIEWRLTHIPVMPMGIDEWVDGWDDFHEPIPYLLHLCYSRHGEADDPADEFRTHYPDHPLPAYLDASRLVSRLRQLPLPEPLDALPDLIEMVHHVTDNVWLDIGEIALAEGGGYPSWDPEQIAWLRAGWQEAQPILERIDRLLAWQNDTLDGLHHKLTAVQHALLAAYSPSPNSGKTAVSL